MKSPTWVEEGVQLKRPLTNPAPLTGFNTAPVGRVDETAASVMLSPLMESVATTWNATTTPGFPFSEFGAEILGVGARVTLMMIVVRWEIPLEPGFPVMEML